MSMIYKADPGMYSDVIFSHLLHFNIDTPENLDNFINPKKRAADMRYFRECLTKFETPAEELCLFFEVIDQRSFAFTKMYGYMSAACEFSMDAIRRYLPDAQTVCAEVFGFYLPKITVSSADTATLARAIAALPISAAAKFHLLAMAADPQPYYEVLFASLENHLTQMQAYYKANRSTIEHMKKSIKHQDIAEFLDKCCQVSVEGDESEWHYSVMLIGKNAVRYVAGENPFLILGFDYSARMALLIGERIQPDIVKIGKALSEEKRVAILQMLLAEEEITAQQLLRRLELSMTATHYHLDMLMQAGMLLARNEGRTIYYSLNREFFDRAPIVFEKFNSKETFER